MQMQYVFQRYEKKYLLNTLQYNRILKGIGNFMKLDQYGKTTICNVYFDTNSDELIRTSLNKPLYKEKFRIRSYGVADANSTVFLEIKKKFKGIVYKRRITMPLSDAQKYTATGVMPSYAEGNIPKEIDYIINHYKLEPKVFIAYDRMAYFAKDKSELRITFDSAIRSRYTDVALDKGDSGELLLDKDTILMEIKIPGAVPLWLSKLLSENKVYPTSFSKYGKIHLHHIKENLYSDTTYEENEQGDNMEDDDICFQVS